MEIVILSKLIFQINQVRIINQVKIGKKKMKILNKMMNLKQIQNIPKKYTTLILLQISSYFKFHLASNYTNSKLTFTSFIISRFLI